MLTQPEFNGAHAAYEHMGLDERMQVIVKMQWSMRVEGGVGLQVYHPLMEVPLISKQGGKDHIFFIVLRFARDLVPLTDAARDFNAAPTSGHTCKKLGCFVSPRVST